MKKERILAFSHARKLTEDEINGVAGSGTSVATGHGTYTPQSGTDIDVDVNVDF